MEFELVASDNKDVYELYLYGDIHKWSTVCANDVVRYIKEAKEKGAKRVNLRIHSGGGSIEEGIAIYNIINSEEELFIDAYIDGVCASMMAVVVMACDKVYMSDAGVFMIHSSRVNLNNATPKVLKNITAMSEKINEQFAIIFDKKTGLGKQKILDDWLSGDDVYFSPQEALKYKLIDEIKTNDKKTATEAINLVAKLDNFDIGKYENIFFNTLNVKNMNNDKVEISKSEYAELLAKKQESEILKAKIAEIDKLQMEAKINNLRAVCTEKKLSNTQTESFVALAQNGNVESVMSIVAQMPVIDLMASINQNKTEGVEMNYDWYAKNRPELLAQWASENHDNFTKLAKGGKL